MAGNFRGHAANTVDGRHYQTITPSAPIQPQVDSPLQGHTRLNDITDYGPWQGRYPIQPPRSHVLRSFLVLIFCCPVVGFVAMIYGFQVDAHFNNNKLSKARFASEMARKLNIAGCILGILTIGSFAVLVILMLSIGLGVGLGSSNDDYDY